MNKKPLAIAGIVIGALIVIGAVFFLLARSRKNQQIPATPTPEEGLLLETPLEERPFVSLTPRADGKELTLKIDNILNADIIEYELTYLSNGLSRGVIGTINLKGEVSVSRGLLLGTCSKNVCKYDEDVSSGTLTLRFRSPEGTRKFIADFRLLQGVDQLTSTDQELSLTANFPASTFYLMMSTIGLPAPIEGELIAGPYGIFTAGAKAIKNGQIEFVSASEEALIYAWTGKVWEEVEEGAVSQLTAFVLVLPTPATPTTE